MTYPIDRSSADNTVSPANRSPDDYADCIRHALLTGGIVSHPRSDRERLVLLAAYPEIAVEMAVQG